MQEQLQFQLDVGKLDITVDAIYLVVLLFDVQYICWSFTFRFEGFCQNTHLAFLGCAYDTLTPLVVQRRRGLYVEKMLSGFFLCGYYE